MTTLWRYTAVTDAKGIRKGELAGGSAADVRASLRRIGLQVVSIKPIHPRQIRPRHDGAIIASLTARWHQHLCARRAPIRAELYDSLATMLEAGVPLVDSIETLMESTQRHGRFSSRRSLFVQLREAIRSGSSLADALSRPWAGGWFGAVEIAMIRAGQHAGTLPKVLRNLASRQERSGELQSKLIGALAYPTVIACVGLGVVVFLSVKTLPELASMLTQADVPVPMLTNAVMAIGQFIAVHWMLIVASCFGLTAAAMLAPTVAQRHGMRLPIHAPQALRRMAVARLSSQLSELVQSGVPLVESMRIAAPSAPGLLRDAVRASADKLERGEELSTALGANGDDAGSGWFDAEFRRLVQVGVWSGELPTILQRLAERFERRARRLIDRLTALLEPVVILTLATLIGIVAMAAILPLVRMQEVLR